MKIRHSAITSDAFQLVTTVEFDLAVGDQVFPTRVELFQDTEQANRFRCRMWERDLFRVKPTLGENNGSDQDNEVDEELMVERTWEISSSFEDFEAPDAEAAMVKFIESLEDYLKRIVP